MGDRNPEASLYPVDFDINSIGSEIDNEMMWTIPSIMNPNAMGYPPPSPSPTTPIASSSTPSSLPSSSSSSSSSSLSSKSLSSYPSEPGYFQPPLPRNLPPQSFAADDHHHHNHHLHHLQQQQQQQRGDVILQNTEFVISPSADGKGRQTPQGYGQQGQQRLPHQNSQEFRSSGLNGIHHPSQGGGGGFPQGGGYHPQQQQQQQQQGTHLKKSYTLEPNHLGLNQQYAQGVNPHSNPSPVQLDPSQGNPQLPKSFSFDTKLSLPGLGGNPAPKSRPPVDPSAASLKDVGRRGNGSGSFAHGSAPYPSPHNLPHSRSYGSVDRINRLQRSDSNISRYEPVYEEKEEQPHEGTYAWLSDFKDKDKDQIPKTKVKPIFRACVNCKRAHLACDSERPCKRCIHLGKAATCIDVEHKKRGRPKLPRNDDGTIVRPAKNEDSEDSEGDDPKEKRKEKKKKDKDAKDKDPKGQKGAQGAGMNQGQGGSSFRPGAFPHDPNQHSSFPPDYLVGSSSPRTPGSNGEDLEFLSVHNLEGIFTMASQECELLFGYSPQEYILHPIYDFVHADDLDALSSLHSRVLNSTELQHPVILRFRQKSGGFLKGELAMTVYKAPDTGRPQSLICSVRLVPKNDQQRQKTPESPSKMYDFAKLPPMPPFYDNPSDAQYQYQRQYQQQQQYQQQLQHLQQQQLMQQQMQQRQIQQQHGIYGQFYPSQHGSGHDPEEPKQVLLHSASFDSLSNTLGNMNVNHFPPRS